MDVWEIMRSSGGYDVRGRGGGGGVKRWPEIIGGVGGTGGGVTIHLNLRSLGLCGMAGELVPLARKIARSS